MKADLCKKNVVLKIFEFALRHWPFYVWNLHVESRMQMYFRPKNGIQSFPLVRGYQVVIL